MTFYRAGGLPEWETSAWLNTDEPLALAGLRGRVVVVYAFQVLCPGCLEFALPQAQRMHEQYARDRLMVGLAGHAVAGAGGPRGEAADAEVGTRERRAAGGGAVAPAGRTAGAAWLNGCGRSELTVRRLEERKTKIARPGRTGGNPALALKPVADARDFWELADSLRAKGKPRSSESGRIQSQMRAER